MTREEARQWFLKVYSEIKGRGYVDENEEAYEMAIKALSQEPCDDAINRDMALEKMAGYAEPQEQTGHWIIDKGSLDAFYGEVCKCSKCGVESIGESDYCPYCGAKMVEPQESESDVK